MSPLLNKYFYTRTSYGCILYIFVFQILIIIDSSFALTAFEVHRVVLHTNGMAHSPGNHFCPPFELALLKLQLVLSIVKRITDLNRLFKLFINKHYKRYQIHCMGQLVLIMAAFVRIHSVSNKNL